MRIISRYVVFLAFMVFVGSAAAGDKVVVVPLIDNAASTPSTLFLKSNGQKIGVLVWMGDLQDGRYASYAALSFKEYYFTVIQQFGQLDTNDGDSSIYFTTGDCTGQAYLVMEDWRHLEPFTESQGRVFSSGGYSVPAYYVPRGTSTEVKTLGSSWYGDFTLLGDTYTFDGSCTPRVVQLVVYPILPNDPAVTGVQNSYQLPIYAGF